MNYVVGRRAYFAPFDQDDVGVFDAETSAFSVVPTGLSGRGKFAGAVAVGGAVYFAPRGKAGAVCAGCLTHHHQVDTSRIRLTRHNPRVLKAHSYEDVFHQLS